MDALGHIEFFILISSSLNTSSGTVSSDCCLITCHFKTDHIFQEFFVCDFQNCFFCTSLASPSIHECDFNSDQYFSTVRVCDFHIISFACEPKCHP